MSEAADFLPLAETHSGDCPVLISIFLDGGYVSACVCVCACVRACVRACLTECDTGYFGRTCSSVCSDKCMNKSCILVHNGIGNCTEGCVPGYQGINCNIPCDNPGGNCTACPGGCDGGYCQLGSSCVSGCVDSHYGTGCDEKSAVPCPENQHCLDCDNTTGHCLTECDTGYFGRMCSSVCSDNCMNKSCILVPHGIGDCTEGCVPGFQGRGCNIPCDSPGGNCTACPGGCDGRYCQLGSSCVSGCEDSYYGTDCKNCSSGCKTCNRMTGTCDEESGVNVVLFMGLAAAGFLFIVTISLVVLCKYRQGLKRETFRQYITPSQDIQLPPEAIEARLYDVVDEAKMYDALTREGQQASEAGYVELRSPDNANISRDQERS
ncbi:cell death abnormality protein 1-like [Haliotis cracherodii]|uniref:cell death abnormality protein 1-like n=1 Tax=Haliotis cracherodii TaxID=6455 RepID=UPI0039EB272A